MKKRGLGGEKEGEEETEKERKRREGNRESEKETYYTKEWMVRPIGQNWGLCE